MNAAEMLAPTIAASPIVHVCSCGFRHTFAGWLAMPLDGHQEIDETEWLDYRTCRSCQSTRTVLVSELVAIDREAYMRDVIANGVIWARLALDAQRRGARLEQIAATACRVLAGCRAG